MTVRYVTALMCTLISTQALADYRGEVSYGWHTLDTDNDEIITQRVESELFLAPARAGDAPHALTGFLSQQSSIRAGYYFSDYDLDDTVIDNELDGFEIGSRFVTQNKLILGGVYRTKTDTLTMIDNTFSSEEETDYFALQTGAYLNDNTALTAEIGREKTTFEETLFDLSTGPTSISHNLLDIGVTMAAPLENGYYSAASLSAGSTFNEDAFGYKTLGFSAGVYPSKTFGLTYALDYQQFDDTDLDITTHTLGLEKYFNPNIAGDLSISHMDADAPIDAIGISLGITGRF